MYQVSVPIPNALPFLSSLRFIRRSEMLFDCRTVVLHSWKDLLEKTIALASEGAAATKQGSPAQ